MKRLWTLILLLGLPNRALAERAPTLAQTSRIELEARDPDDLAQRITALARELGGQIVQAGGDSVALDVPNAKYPELKRRLAELGAVRSEQTAGEDLTDQLAEARARAESARQSHERMRGVAPIARSVEESLALERELESSKKAIADAEARARALDRRGATTRVMIRFQSREVEAIERPSLPFPWLGELGLPRLTDTSSASERPAMELRAMIDGELALAGALVEDEDRVDGTAYTVAALTSLRALGESSPVGLFGGMDLSLGFGGGFLYGAQTLLGLGMPIGTSVAIGIGSGPGIDGITSAVPFGVRFPIELYVFVDVADFVQASAFVQDGWVLVADARDDGSEHAPFGDELAAGLSLGFGTRDDGYARERFGPRLGFVYRELMGTAFYELRLGFGANEMDMSESY